METLSTVVFFPIEKSPMRIDTAAAEALVEGEFGRYLRSLKSLLGLPLLYKLRPFGGRQLTIAEIISDFLTELRQRFRRVLSGGRCDSIPLHR